jgi:hypothetical protein
MLLRTGRVLREDDERLAAASKRQDFATITRLRAGPTREVGAADVARRTQRTRHY